MQGRTEAVALAERLNDIGAYDEEWSTYGLYRVRNGYGA
jgi:hypothetical protein